MKKIVVRFFKFKPLLILLSVYLALDSLIHFGILPVDTENSINQTIDYAVALFIFSSLGLLTTLRIISRKKKRYGWAVLLILIVTAILVANFSNNYWAYPLYTFITSIFSVSLIALLILTLRFLINYFRDLFLVFSKIRIRHLKGLFQIILTILVGVLVYQNMELSKRLKLVETRLGGSSKLACNEKDTIEKVRKSVVRVVGGESEGSGFVAKSDGTIMTNFHVIEFEPSPKVLLPDNTFRTAKIVMADKNADIALLKIDTSLPVVTWGNTYGVDPGDELMAVGYPFGGDLVGESTVNKGSLSGRRFDKNIGIEYLQTDATLNSGVSGGPMVNICGEVVGMNTMGTAGLGLAISSATIKQKWLDLAVSDNPLKDIREIVFEPEKGPLEAVEAFYNYIKLRKLDEAFGLLSDNYKGNFKFESWKKGYETNLDTSVISIKQDKFNDDLILVKLATKDLLGDEIKMKFFEGVWEVKNVDGKWLLWDPEIKEVPDPDYMWFYE